ncbi:hypothetical protein BD414DRAFT_498875 [Trametes punicea]|nr:hypothetical protein BD414DRAFT_498875 [Trametes punicea]
MTLLRCLRPRSFPRPHTPPLARVMSSSLPNDSSLPGEHFEVRQTAADDDYHPDPSQSLPLSPARQALLDDIIALYSCQPTRRRVERYTPDCVYDDQFVYANDRYKMAGQWFALPKLFRSSKNEGYQIVTNDPLLIQFRNEQTWTFPGGIKSTTINALVSLSLDPDSADSDFPQVKYHKDQANGKDYSHTGPGFAFKKWQADKVAGIMDSEDVQHFKKDARDDNKEDVRRYDSGTADAPQKKDL